MRKCLIAAVMLSAAVVFASCERNDNSVPECNLVISMGSDDNTVRVSVAPSDESVDYLYGIIMEDDYAALGEDGLVSYINDLISKGAPLKQGSSSELYSDLFWHTRYYAFAAQVNDGTVYGTPVVESIRTYRPYVDFAPEGVLIAPYAVSDNGLWVVGNYDDGANSNSYIYDVRRDELTVIQGCVLYDITDAGVAYGKDIAGPVYYENGQIVPVQAPAGSSQSGFYGVSPDGAVAVGYSMDEDWNNEAIIYENGTLSNLTGTDLGGNTPVGIVAKGIGSNGNIAGYLTDFDYYVELGCLWLGASHEFDLFPKEFMTEFNEDMGAWTKRYGDLEMHISPNGKFLSAWVYVTESWESMPQYAYVYDIEGEKMYEVSDNAYDCWRPCVVTSDGLLFLADTPDGVSSQPYVYDFNTGKVETFKDYASATWGYSSEEAVFEGSVLAVSDDASVIVGNYTDESNFYTTIYFMPEK